MIHEGTIRETVDRQWERFVEVELSGSRETCEILLKLLSLRGDT